MYVTIFLIKNHYLLKDIFIEPQKCELSEKIIVKICIIEKSKKIHSEKNCKLIFSGTVEKFLKIAHDTIQCLKNAVHYLNMIMPDILVEIID